MQLMGPKDQQSYGSGHRQPVVFTVVHAILEEGKLEPDGETIYLEF